MTEVTRDNFEDILPKVEHAIKTSDFIAIDSEFSGLEYSDDDKPSLFDSGSDRYYKLKKNVENFTLLQIGLTTFCGNKETNRYQSQTFQFYLFPKSFGSYDQRLSVQASSIQFLCKHKFDFNKWLRNGISFMNDAEEKEVVQLLESGYLNLGLERQTCEREMQNLCSYVTAWIPTSQPGNNLTLSISQDFSDFHYCFHKALRERFPQIWTSANAFDQFVVKRVTPEERKHLEKEDTESDKCYKEQLVNDLLGFTRVFRLLVASKKPIVGHNMLTDLLFMLHKFHAPLPESYETFKQELHTLFPAVYDTKHVHFCMKKTLESQGVIFARSLEELYSMLTSERVMNMSLMNPSILRQTDLPEQSTKIGDTFHHAGYDAFICGSVFLRLCHFLHSKKFSSTFQEGQQFLFKNYLPNMSNFCNCVNVIRASVTYIKLDENDPLSLRPPLLFVKAKVKSALNGTSLAVLMSPHGTVDIKMLNPTDAIVATTNYCTAREIIIAFKQDPLFDVTNYRYWKHSSIGKGIWWSSMAVAAGSCALVMLSLLRN